MNEQSPERHLFRPTEQYKETVGFLLNNLFATPVQSPELTDPETMTTRRLWRKDGMTFLASGIDPQYIPLMVRKREAYQVTMLRMSPPEDGLIQVRGYVYDRLSGEMQASNWLFTPEEVTTMSMNHLFSEAVREEFGQHVHTASQVDYLDFLTDIDGFRDSTDI